MKRALAATTIISLALSACEPATPPGAVPVPQARAQALFLEHCAICHGERGDGHGPRRASLFRKPPDFRDPHWRAGRTPAEIAASIRDGLPGSDMPAWRRLSDSEIAGLAAYVLGLAGT